MNVLRRPVESAPEAVLTRVEQQQPPRNSGLLGQESLDSPRLGSTLRKLTNLLQVLAAVLAETSGHHSRACSGRSAFP
jgi:hypothetical protein